MRLAVALPDRGPREEILEFARAADDLGYHSLWAAETWRFNAFMFLASLAEHSARIGLGTAVVSVFSRPPALLAMSVATLDSLSGNRAIPGLGTSDPFNVEGWYGVPFVKPVQRLRETVDIVRTILRGESPTYDGEVIKQSTAIRMPDPPRADVPIMVAAFGPRNVAQTAEIAHGWLPIFWSPAKAKAVFGPPLERGLADRSPALPPLEIMPLVPVCIMDRADELKQAMKRSLAFFIGGMGQREQSFYNTLYRRYGYESEAARIRDVLLERGAAEAASYVTDEMVDEVSAIGSAPFVKDRLAAFADAGATVPIVDLAADDHRERLSMLERLSSIASE